MSIRIIVDFEEQIGISRKAREQFLANRKFMASQAVPAFFRVAEHVQYVSARSSYRQGRTIHTHVNDDVYNFLLD